MNKEKINLMENAGLYPQSEIQVKNIKLFLKQMLLTNPIKNGRQNLLSYFIFKQF